MLNVDLTPHFFMFNEETFSESVYHIEPNPEAIGKLLPAVPVSQMCVCHTVEGLTAGAGPLLMAQSLTAMEQSLHCKLC